MMEALGFSANSELLCKVHGVIYRKTVIFMWQISNSLFLPG